MYVQKFLTLKEMTLNERWSLKGKTIDGEECKLFQIAYDNQLTWWLPLVFKLFYIILLGLELFSTTTKIRLICIGVKTLLKNYFISNIEKSLYNHKLASNAYRGECGGT